MRIPQFAKIPTPLSWLAEILEKEKGYLFELHRREAGGDTDINSSAQNAALFVYLL